MFGIGTEWWILYGLHVVIAFTALRCFVNGVVSLEGELRGIRNNVKELDGPEILREVKASKYIIEGLEGDYDGFVLKERVDSAGYGK